MKISTIHKFEKAVILFLNTFDEWDLEHTGHSKKCYDAIGKTPKGRKCIMEMKFRKKYYESKLIEVDKYNCLMDFDPDYVKIYFVSDPQGTYLYWLDGIKKFDSIKKYCPDTTIWNNKKKMKEVYLLPESIASYMYKI